MSSSQERGVPAAGACHPPSSLSSEAGPLLNGWMSVESRAFIIIYNMHWWSKARNYLLYNFI